MKIGEFHSTKEMQGTPLFSCVSLLNQFTLTCGSDGFAPVSSPRYRRLAVSKQFGIIQLQFASNSQYRQIAMELFRAGNLPAEFIGCTHEGLVLFDLSGLPGAAVDRAHELGADVAERILEGAQGVDRS